VSSTSTTPPSTTPLSSTPRSSLGRLAERGRTDRADLYDVLDAGIVCHLGIVLDGAPVVLPTGYGRVDDTLYLHGSTGASTLRGAATGLPVCVTVTHVDGVVYARSVFVRTVFGDAEPAPDLIPGTPATPDHVRTRPPR